MKIENIQNLKYKNIRLFPLQTQDIYFILYHDLPSLYLISLLVDKLWFHISQFSIEYVYPFRNYFNYISEKLGSFTEDYFIFWLENYYHSSDYAHNFMLKVLNYMQENNIEKKVIIHTIKSNEENIQEIMEKYPNVILVLNTDSEYFFNEFFYKKTPITEISNIYFRDDDGEYHATKRENVDYDLGEYIIWWYYNKYFFNFPKSKDEIIFLRSNEKRKVYNDDIFYQWTNEKYTNLLRNLWENHIMLTTGRWCRFNCSYCYRWVKYNKVRQIPIDVIKKDLDTIQQLWYTDIYLYDDCFVSTNHDRLDEIIELFSQYPFYYQIASRYETLNEVNLEKLSKAKIKKIQVWLQSIWKQANLDSKRNINIEKFTGVIQNMKSKGMNISIDLILWLPGDTVMDFIKTFHFAVSLQPTSVFINKLFLNPKTELDKNKEKYGIKTEHDTGLKKDFYVPKIHYSDTFTQKDLLIAEKYILASMKKIDNVKIILR